VAVSAVTITICFNRCVFVSPSIQPLMRHSLILLLVYHVTSQLYMNCPAYKQFGQKLRTNFQRYTNLPYLLLSIIHTHSSFTNRCTFIKTLITVYINTLRTGLLNCLNARSQGLIFRHRASSI